MKLFDDKCPPPSWFHVTPRWSGAQSYRALFQNKNAGNPNAWTYDPDPSKREEVSKIWRNLNLRLTWQATPRKKFGMSYDQAISEEHLAGFTRTGTRIMA